MFSEQSKKSLIVFIVYGLIMAVLAWLGYQVSKTTMNIGASVGSLLGGLVGLMIGIVLWVKVGQKFVETTQV